MLNPFHIHTDSDVGGLVAHVSPIANFHPDRIEIHHRVERLQGPGLPGEDLIGDLVDDIADCLVGQVRSQRGSQMVFDIADSSIPPAYREMIISSNPPSRRVPLGTSIGVNVPARSRGIASSTSPGLASSRFYPSCRCGRFSDPSADRSPFSYPRWSVSSACKPRSSAALINAGTMPPSPVSCTSPESI